MTEPWWYSGGFDRLAAAALVSGGGSTREPALERPPVVDRWCAVLLETRERAILRCVRNLSPRAETRTRRSANRRPRELSVRGQGGKRNGYAKGKGEGGNRVGGGGKHLSRLK